MKLKFINENTGKWEEVSVSFWSFMKCNLLTYLAAIGILYGVILVFTILFAGIGAFL